MSTSTTKNIMLYVHVAITFFFMFIFGKIVPPIDPITPIGMELLGIFIGVVYAWTTTSLLWPSLLAMAAICLTGAYTMADFLKVSFGNSTVVFLMFILAFCTCIEDAGLMNFISSWIMSRKIVEKRPWIFSYFLLIGAYIGGIFVNAMAATVIFWGILYAACYKFDIKPHSAYPNAMIFGIAFAALTAGCTVLPFRVTGLVLLGTFSAASGGLTVPYAQYIIFTFIMGFIFITAYILMCRYLFRVDVSPLANISSDLVSKDDLILSKRQKALAAAMIIMILLLLLPDIAPKSWWITTQATQLGTCGIMYCIIVAMLLIRVEGQPLMEFQKSARGINWGMICLFALVLPFSSLLTNDITGIKPFLLNIFTPIFMGKPAIVYILTMGVILAILTNFANNAVLAVIFINLSIPICENLGISPAPVLMVILYCSQFAYMTPAASSSSAFMFGNTEWVKPSNMYKYILGALVVFVILTFIIALPFANLLFGNIGI